MEFRIAEQVNGNFLLFDDEDDSPLMTISFANEAQAMDRRKKLQVVKDASARLAQELVLELRIPPEQRTKSSIPEGSLLGVVFEATAEEEE